MRCKPKYLGGYAAETTTDGNKLVVEIQDFTSEYIVQNDKLSFVIQSCISYPSTKINNVVLSINKAEFDLVKIGNVKWDQIKAGVCYTVVIGTEEPTATVMNTLPCSKFDYPTYQTNTTSSTFEKVVS